MLTSNGWEHSPENAFHGSQDFAVPSPLTPPSPPIYPRPHLLPIWAHQPPKALVIQLKRFVFDKAAAKVKDHILFGAKLKLGVSGPERLATYDLTG